MALGVRDVDGGGPSVLSTAGRRSPASFQNFFPVATQPGFFFCLEEQPECTLGSNGISQTGAMSELALSPANRSLERPKRL